MNLHDGDQHVGEVILFCIPSYRSDVVSEDNRMDIKMSLNQGYINIEYRDTNRVFISIFSVFRFLGFAPRNRDKSSTVVEY